MLSSISISSTVVPLIIIFCVLFILGLLSGIIIWIYKSRVIKKKSAKIEEVHDKANQIYKLLDKEKTKEDKDGEHTKR